MAVAKLKCKCGCKKFQDREKVIKTPFGNFFNKDHAQEYAISFYKKDKAKKLTKAKQSEVKKEKAVKKFHLKQKEFIKPKSKWLAEAQAAFNKYIRLRDYKDPCISCGKSKEQIEEKQGWKTGGCWDAGHFMTRGAKGQLRFVLFNVHKQCKSCNGGGGRFSSKAATVDSKYRINLIEKIGIDKIEWIENNNDIDLKKGDIEYLKRIKRIFNKRARWYEKRVFARI